MFHVSGSTVIDNTRGGSYSRFTNHCCSPCLYAKPLELGGELHLCFFARCDIRAGQELTFDYRYAMLCIIAIVVILYLVWPVECCSCKVCLIACLWQYSGCHCHTMHAS